MSTYKVLYINENGADVHNIGFDDHPDDFVTDLRISLGDSVDEVDAYVIGVPSDPERPWLIEPIEVL